MSADAPSAQTRLACPRCGGGMTALDGAAAVVCPSCGERFFLGEDGTAGWLLPPAVHPSAAREAARRRLREEGRRVTRIGEPYGLLIPFHWVRGLRFVWTLADPGRRRSGSDPARVLRETLGDAGPSSFDSEIWEARPSVESYSRTFPAHPLARTVTGGATRLESLDRELLDPDRLPPGYRLLDPAVSAAEVHGEAARWLTGRDRLRSGSGRRGSHLLHERMNVTAVPVAVVPFAFREVARGAVLVDGVTGKVLRVLDGEPPAGDPEAPGETPRYSPPVLLPLECGECGWELEPAERDRLFPCSSCGAAWEMVGRERRRVRQWFRDADPDPAGRQLPFWAFGGGGDGNAPPPRPMLVPAYAARHLEAQMHLATRLTRTPPAGDWTVDPLEPPSGAAVGSDEAAGWRWAVEGALARESLATFSTFLREERTVDERPAGLVWLPFRREGGDLVEPDTGARTRFAGTLPWDARAAA